MKAALLFWLGTTVALLHAQDQGQTLVDRPGSDRPASATTTAKLDPQILAKFGETKVKTEDIRAALNSLDAKQREAFNQDPESLRKTVSSLILQRMVLQEALGKKWDQQPAVIAELKRAREAALMQSYLASVSHPPADYPSAADLQAAYDANKTAMVLPRQYRLAQIFVASSSDPATAAVAKAKLEAVQKSLGQPSTDFAAIARMSSDDKRSAAQGGEIGWLTENQIQPEIRPQILALTKDTISAPLQLKDGWHFLKVLEVKEAGTPTLEQVRPQLIQRMREQKEQANSQAYLAHMLQSTPVTLNAQAFSTLLKKE